MSKNPTPSPELLAELRARIKSLEVELEKARDRHGDTFSQVRHLEKTGESLRSENEALHRSLRDAQIDRAHAAGRAEVLEAFTPEVMVPVNRFPRARPVGSDMGFYDAASPKRRWFEGG